MNKFQLIGRLGKDPVMRFSPSGKAVTTLSIATDASYKDASGQKVEKTDWHLVSCWGKLAEITNQYLRKGRQVFVEGRISQSAEGEGENRKYYTNLVATQIEFLGSANGGAPEADLGDTPAEDIPF